MGDPIQYWESELNKLHCYTLSQNDEYWEYLCLLIEVLYRAASYDIHSNCIRIFAIIWDYCMESELSIQYSEYSENYECVKLSFELRS